MKKLLTLVVLFAAGAVLAEDAKDAKKELEKFNGTWTGAFMTNDGKEMPKDDVEKITLTVKGEKYTLMTNDETIEGTHKLDPTKDPKTIDAVRTKGPDKGKEILGIYELDKDTYKVCFAAPGKPRPTEFSSKPGSGHRLIVMKRSKS